jgi:hypothetical protein
LIPINIGVAERCHLKLDRRGEIMIGITLTSEQIRTAPTEVRRWIEREVMISLGLSSQSADGSKPHGEHALTGRQRINLTFRKAR